MAKTIFSDPIIDEHRKSVSTITPKFLAYRELYLNKVAEKQQSFKELVEQLEAQGVKHPEREAYRILDKAKRKPVKLEEKIDMERDIQIFMLYYSGQKIKEIGSQFNLCGKKIEAIINKVRNDRKSL